MLFNSLHFFYFLPIVFILYYFIPQKYSCVLIFIASCYFYMAFVPKYILILFLIILIDYFSGIKIENSKSKKNKQIILTISLICNIALLAFFKYFNFINQNIEDLFLLFGSQIKPVNLNIILPIGLSFHTFQSMSYTIEVYRGNQKAEKHLGYFANYVLFFPQMVAGPIEKYATLGIELRKNIIPNYDNFANGFRLILFGLFIKMTIADNIAPIVNQIYDNPSQYNSFTIFNAILLFSIQIYADFFGYSTIAIGTAKLLGINLIDNFKTPYITKSIVEFWKGWHISLTTWFREYLFIPLGGSRVNNLRWIINILIIFLVSGLWHGASWTFVIWGFLHGLFYLLERGATKLFKIKLPTNFGIVSCLLIIKNYILVSLIWVFFRAESFDKIKLIFTSLYNNTNIKGNTVNYGYSLIFAITIILIDVLLINNRFDNFIQNKSTLFRWGCYTILLFCLLTLSGIENLPFIYFQF